MEFDKAFERVIGHEGGYVNDPRAALEYVNGSFQKSRSRIQGCHARGIGGGGAGPHTSGGCNIRSADEFAQLRLHGDRVHTPGLRKGDVQRTLHSSSQGSAYGRACASQKTRGRVRGVRKRDGGKGWLGALSTSLPTGPIRDAEGCSHYGIGWQVRQLRRDFPQSGFRFSSSRRQDQFAERDVHKQVSQRACQRASEMRTAVRQLSPFGA